MPEPDPFTLETLEEARRSLNWEYDTHVERLACTLSILLEGFLDVAIKQTEQEQGE